MTKGDTLQARLARSLDQANRNEGKGGAKVGRQSPAPAPLPAGGKCTKLSVSLFETDLRRLDAIGAYMAERGHRLSTSHLVKLALRTAPLSEELVTALDQTRAEDGRKW